MADMFGQSGSSLILGIAGAVVALLCLVIVALLLPARRGKALASGSDAMERELAVALAERDAARAEVRAQTEQREKIEAALLQSQKLEAVGQLTGGIAHDFNNLLQAVAGNLELIARKPDDPDRVVRWSSSALDAVERGRNVTSQLLAFSSKQRLDVTSVRLVELIGGMRGLIDRAVAPLGQLRVEPIDPSLNVATDPLQLELAILNLAFNARDAMPEGGVFSIVAKRESGKVVPELPVGDYVALTLSDTGIGMSSEVARHAIEPFFTTKGTGSGAGIGLSMAIGVARQSGGTLVLASEEGKGTTVTLYLRLAVSEPLREVQDDAANDMRADLSGYRIALVDDDGHVRATLVDMLHTAGAEVIEAHDGNSGVALVKENRPDMLVVDFAMPGMTGADVARRVRTEDAHLPIIVVTGYAESEALDAIADPKLSILRKPFESQQLLRRVSEMLER